MQTIRFCYTKKNPLVIPLLIAKQKGYFTKRDIDVKLNLADDFNFGGKNPFMEGESDMMMGDLTFFFYMLEQGKQAVLTSNLTRTIGVVGRAGMTPPYRGIKVGVNRKGLFRLFLENDLQTLMPEAEIVWLNNSYDRMKALEEGTIDALVAIEPFVSDLIEKGYEMIWDTRESDKNLVMWCFDETFYTQNKDAVRSFHAALEEAMDTFNALTPEERRTLCVEELGYASQIAERMAEFTFEKQASIRVQDYNLCQEWMLKTGEISQSYDAYQKIVTDVL